MQSACLRQVPWQIPLSNGVARTPTSCDASPCASQRLSCLWGPYTRLLLDFTYNGQASGQVNITRFAGELFFTLLECAASSNLQENSVLAVKAINRYLLIVRQRALELVLAPTWQGVRTPYSGLSRVVSCIEMDAPASSAVIVYRKTTSSPIDDDIPDWPAEPVTVLSRTSDQGFETLQQYDLLPNPKAKQPGQSKDTDVTVPDFSPCLFPSQCTRLISVAPSSCDFRVGSCGKGFWTETRNVTLRHTRTPARCLVGFTVRSNPYESKSKAPGERTADVQLCKDTLYTRRCNIHEILWKNYIMTSTALEDTVGRIAVGDVTGKVEVLDLAC